MSNEHLQEQACVITKTKESNHCDIGNKKCKFNTWKANGKFRMLLKWSTTGSTVSQPSLPLCTWDKMETVVI